MFSGLVEEIGCIQAIENRRDGFRLRIKCSSVLEEIKIGDSLSLNGCCLTVIHHDSSSWTCDVVQETLNKTNLKHLQLNDRVNLERAIRYQDRLGGHLVQGHIDETGQILKKQSLSDDSWWVSISASQAILRYIVPKGSIAVDGISLTVADLQDGHFSFAMIPHTAHHTTMGSKKIGDVVNLEVDMIAKYIERLTIPFLIS